MVLWFMVALTLTDFPLMLIIFHAPAMLVMTGLLASKEEESSKLSLRIGETERVKALYWNNLG